MVFKNIYKYIHRRLSELIKHTLNSIFWILKSFSVISLEGFQNGRHNKNPISGILRIEHWPICEGKSCSSCNVISSNTSEI